jgi:hypothetical protein
MNGAGRWRCSLDWMTIHTAMRTSLIIHDRLRQGAGENWMSTFGSRYLVSDSNVCRSIFKNYLPTPMMRPSDCIIFTISFTPPWIYYKFDLIFCFVGTHERFVWIYLGPWCSRTIVQTRCRWCHFAFLMICSTY